jgi:hypothetical protein
MKLQHYMRHQDITDKSGDSIDVECEETNRHKVAQVVRKCREAFGADDSSLYGFYNFISLHQNFFSNLNTI